jgi:hypothetical protein
MPLSEEALKRFKRRIVDVGKVSPHTDAVRKFLEGDHWQDVNGWVGPMPPQEHPNYGKAVELVKRIFVSHNLIAETTERHKDSCVAKQCDWGFTVQRTLEGNQDEISAEEQTLVDEANTLVNVWWEEKKPWKNVQETTRFLVALQKGVCRFFIPESQLERTLDDDGNEVIVRDENGQGSIVADNTLEAAKKIFFQKTDPFVAGTLTSNEGINDGAYFYFMPDSTDLRRRKKRLELQYLDREGKTVISVENDNGGFDEAGYNLGGNLMIYEVNRSLPLFSESVVSQQKVVNKYQTLNSRNGDSVYRQLFVLAGMKPGHYEEKEVDGEMKKVWVEDGTFQTGPGVTAFIAPYQSEDQDGKTSMIAPSLETPQPFDMGNLLKSKEDAKNSLLEEVKQIHVTISGDATATGRSRVQATADYANSLSETITEVEELVKWMLTTLIRLAAVLAGEPGKFDSLRAYCNLNIFVSPPSAEDLKMWLSMVEKGTMSARTFMLLSNVIRDPEAEETQIKLERKNRLGLADLNATRDSLSNAVQRKMLSQYDALIQAGFEAPDAAAMVKRLQEETSSLESGVSDAVGAAS